MHLLLKFSRSLFNTFPMTIADSSCSKIAKTTKFDMLFLLAKNSCILLQNQNAEIFFFHFMAPAALFTKIHHRINFIFYFSNFNNFFAKFDLRIFFINSKNFDNICTSSPCHSR